MVIPKDTIPSGDSRDRDPEILRDFPLRFTSLQSLKYPNPLPESLQFLRSHKSGKKRPEGFFTRISEDDIDKFFHIVY